jgi:hypothetical protein
VGSLTVDRKPTTVTQTPVAAEVHQALDVDRHLAPEVALDGQVGVDVLADELRLPRRRRTGRDVRRFGARQVFVAV